MAMVTSAWSSDSAVMFKVIGVPANSTLEVLFSLLVRGWRSSDDLLVRLANPDLQVLYDDVVVFNLDDVIKENPKNFADDKWNQFRLSSTWVTTTLIFCVTFT